MSWGLETGGPAAPDPGTCRAGRSQQPWIYAPSPQHLPPPPQRGTSTPTAWHPASRQLEGLHVNHSHHSKTQGRRPTETGPSWEQAPITSVWSWTTGTPCPAPSCQRDMGARQLSPCSSCWHHPPTAAGTHLRGGCHLVVPMPCLGDMWGHFHVGTWIPWSPKPAATWNGWVPRGCGCQGQICPRGERMGGWVQEKGVPRSGVAGAGGEWQGLVWPLPNPAGASKGQRLGMPQLFPEQRGLPEKAPAGYFRVGSDSPLAGCRGLHKHLPQPPPTPSPRSWEGTAPVPIPLCPMDPSAQQGAPGSLPRTSAGSSLGCFHPTAGLTPVPLPTSPGSPEWGCCAGFAPGSVPWDAGWLCGRAAGAEPCWKGLMERWPRTETVNTAGAPRKCRPLLPLPARLPGPPPCPPCQDEDRDGTIEAIPPIPAHVSEHGKVKSLPGHCWRLSEWPPCLT